MENKTVWLYSENDLEAVLKKKKGCTFAALALACAGLIVCVFCAFHAKDADALNWFKIAAAVSLLAGWTVITLRVFVIEPLKAAEKHIRTMFGGEYEKVAGSFSLTGERIDIRKGVSMYRVCVDGNEAISSMSIYEKKAKLFDAEKAALVYSVYGFIAGYEEQNEDD